METHREICSCKKKAYTEAKTGARWPQAKEFVQSPEAGRSEVPVLPYSLRESVPGTNDLDVYPVSLILDFWFPELGGRLVLF